MVDRFLKLDIRIKSSHFIKQQLNFPKYVCNVIPNKKCLCNLYLRSSLFKYILELVNKALTTKYTLNMFWFVQPCTQFAFPTKIPFKI